MNYKTIRYDERDGYAEITLDRPDKRNAFNGAMHAELRQAIARAADSPLIRAILITGAGKGFCAGQDLSDRKRREGQGPRDLGASLRDHYNPLIRTLRDLEMPVVCAVNGVAAGAGANIALACDIVVAARSAAFIQAFSRIGLVPDSGGTYHLPRLVGHARAMGLTLLGERLPAEQAAAWGLIWKCVDDDALLDEARAIAAALGNAPTTGLALTKQALNASWRNDLDDQLTLESELQGVAGRTDDYAEGVAAFLEKRKPKFKGH